MAHRAFDEQMEVLEALKGRSLDAEGIALVQKSLAHKSNFIVAKAARLAEESGLASFLPDLTAAFERFFTNPEKTDPQCWAKNALSHALKNLQCLDKEIYLRGLSHHQMEPVWGGRSDSAGTLRVNCAYALLECDGLQNQDLVLILLDLLVDEDARVRQEGVRVLAQLGDAAIPVLRLQALLAQEKEEADVMGTCFSALVGLEQEDAIPFVARFLDGREEIAGEAAIALAETHSSTALAGLLDRRTRVCEPVFAEVLLSAIALTRLPEAIAYLIGMIEKEEREAPLALAALARISPNEELRGRIEQVVGETGSPRILAAFHEHLHGSSEQAGQN